MADWVFVLTPLLVLPIVLLFRFVGCGTQLVVDPDTVSYRDYIMGEFGGPAVMPAVPNPTFVPKNENVIAYWRLVDPETIPTSGVGRINSPAIDEKAFQNGVYITVPPPGLLPETPGTTLSAGSEAAPGDFAFGKQSLIKSDPAVKCRLFNGGYVKVPFKPGLYTQEFTIEAWISPLWGPQFDGDYEHVLFSAGGYHLAPGESYPAYHGFRIFAYQARWRVRLFGSNDALSSSASPGPLVIKNDHTHIAFTVENPGSSKRMRLFVNGHETVDVNGVAYTLPNGEPLYIGVTNQGNSSENPLKNQPILSMIQEVVLHKKALSPEEIQNHVSLGS